MGDNATYDWDAYWDDEDDDGDWTSPFVRVRTVTCRYCGKDGLNWSQTATGKWWLKNEAGEWHKCEPGGRNAQ